MNNFTFITGATRSGKSSYAQELAKLKTKKVAFVATCIPGDKEMIKRIALHKKSRPAHWKLIEEPVDIKGALKKVKDKYDVVIIDCLGLLVTNYLESGLGEKIIIKKIKEIAKILSKAKFKSILISNEVGAGIVPDNALARNFRDLIGFSNQIMAKHADTVYIMHVGIAMRIK